MSVSKPIRYASVKHQTQAVTSQQEYALPQMTAQSKAMVALLARAFTIGILCCICQCRFVFKSTSETGEVTHYLHLCEGETHWVQCSNTSEVIFIENTFYAQSENDACNEGSDSQRIIPCTSRSASSIIWRTCSEKKSCRLIASKSAFGNDCQGEAGYIYMKYRCTVPGVTHFGKCAPNSWGSWINSDSPAGSGDFELLVNHKKSNKVPCDEPIGMEIRLDDGSPFTWSNNAVKTGLDYGITCVHNQQSNLTCRDFKVRYCCEGTLPKPQCRRPVEPSNGIFVTTRDTDLLDVGTTIFYACNPGYEMVGQARQTCLSTSRWSAATPTCRRKVTAQCRNPRPPQNGLLSYGLRQEFPVGSRVYYSCEIGFQLVGEASPVCLRTLRWSSDDPTCVKKDQNVVRYCYAFGFPNYETFDNKVFQFGGVCSYSMARTKNPSKADAFAVEISNNFVRDKTEKTWNRKVIVKTYGHVIEMTYGKRVLVDGELVRLPYEPTEQLKITISGRFVELTTDFSMSVTYDGRGFISLGMPQRYDSLVEGLCGNLNGDPSDDFIVEEGRLILSDVNQFGNYYHLDVDDNCPKDDNLVVGECWSASNLMKHRRSCSIITDTDGPLSGCSPSPAELHARLCEYDLCAQSGSRESLEYTIASYVEKCQRNGAKLDDWRAQTNTPMTCPPNSKYQVCGSRCPATCGNQDALNGCSGTCVEGCACEAGFLLSDNECVPRSECGCMFERKFYKNEEVLVTWSCSRKCKCLDSEMVCSSHSCSEEETCEKGSNGRESCVSKEVKSCRAWGAPHYMTFDGSGWYDFMGLCDYTMSESFKIPRDDPRWFSVQAKSDSAASKNRFLHLQSVRVLLRNATVSISLINNGTVSINRNNVLEADTDLFTVARSGKSTVITTRYGLEVSFTGQVMNIKLASTYKSKVRGLCGDYNGFAGDDLLLHSGTVASTYDEFLVDYQLGSCQNQGSSLFICPPDAINLWSSMKYCGALADLNGPFHDCHRQVDPARFIEKCVFDVCVTSGDEEVLSQALEEYVEACKTAGVDLCDWRDDSENEKTKCPAHSTYSGCAPSCQDTCFNPTASLSCQNSTVEDCVCDFGYVLEGQRCVTKYDCGCVKNGLYVWKGGVIYDDDANLECKCIGLTKFECHCVAGYTSNNGVCEDVNECESLLEDGCDQKADCVNTIGSYHCECRRGLVGDGTLCKASGCNRPPDPTNGRIVPNARRYSLYSRVTYVCNAGYEVIGFPHRICEEDGTWANKEPLCFQEARCPQPTIPQNGELLSSKLKYIANDWIGYHCDAGYHLATDAFRQCKSDGTWSGVDPICRAICPQPKTLENGEVLSSRTEYLQDNSIKYECDEGYSLTTSTTRICLPDGTWSGSEPLCEETRCAPPSLPINGGFVPNRNGSWQVNSRITYLCDNGFASTVWKLVEAVCLPNGVWSSQPHDCVDVDECALTTCPPQSSVDDVNNCLERATNCHQYSDCVNTPGSYTCICRDGYTGDGRNCTHHIPCPPPKTFRNGRIETEDGGAIRVGSVVTYLCDNGYYLDGIDTNECNVDGKWSTKFSQCVDFDECKLEPCHGNATCLNVPGSFICICKDGFEGDGIRHCAAGECITGDCGCFANETYYAENEIFYTKNCESVCACKSGSIECTGATCEENQECLQEYNGKYTCAESSRCEIGVKIRPLPPDCLDVSNRTQEYDAGQCTHSKCASDDATGRCCGISMQETEEIPCTSESGQYTLSVNKVTSCQCEKCIGARTSLHVRAYGINEINVEVPFEFGEVWNTDEELITHTGSDGSFSMSVDEGQNSILLRFVDQHGVFISSLKAIEVTQDGGSLYVDVVLPMLQTGSLREEAQQSSEIAIGNTSIRIKPNSFFTKTGLLYQGKVTIQGEYIDKRDQAVGKTVPGRSRGMMIFYDILYFLFRGERNEALDLKNVQIYPSTTSPTEIELDHLYLWQLNPADGYWEKKKKCQKHSIDMVEKIMCEYNINGDDNFVAVARSPENTCYVKVRGYRNDKYDGSEQIENLFVEGNYDKEGIWHGFGREITSSRQGACVPMPCDAGDGYTGTLTVTTNSGASLHAETDTEYLTFDDLRSVTPTNGSLEFEFSRISENLPRRGPVYETKETCMAATISSNHIRFHLQSRHVFEFNTVPIDEANILRTWFETPLTWWPRPLDFTACYIKVGIHGTPSAVSAKSYVGQRSDVLGRLYGIRSDKSSGGEEESAACLEFKCSGLFLDGSPDITFVHIEPRGRCFRTWVNPNLEALNNAAYQPQRNDNSFRMFMPKTPPNNDFGLYSFTSRDLLTSKLTALRLCNSGGRPQSLAMDALNGLALVFECL